MSEPQKKPTGGNAIEPRSNQHADYVAALEAQKAFLRQVLDINPNLIFAKDREGRFVLVNQAVADVYGTTIEGLIGKTDADFNANEEEVAFFRRMDLEVMDTLKEKLIPEEQITDSTGQVRTLQTVKRPIIGADGQANQVLGVATDITQHKRLEEQLRHSQKMEALGLLAGGVAHDFNNILAVVLGNAELMLSRLRKSGKFDDRLVASIELIVESARRAEGLTRQLMAFGRRHPINPKRINLNDVVSGLRDLLLRLISESSRLEMELSTTPLWVFADPTQVEQIVMNLVVNARDAMPKGGLIRITTCFASLTEHEASAYPNATVGDFAVLQVVDQGVGMSAQIRARIFEPFFTTKPVGQGTGLGLSTVYGIVKHAGGFLAVDSEPGRGSVFRVYLPRTEPEPNGAVHAPDAGDSPCGHETILICEDEAEVLNVTRGILASAGYRVLCASGGQAAIALADEHDGPIHLLLSDVVMPCMNGRQLAETLQRRRPDLRVLYMTGYPSNVLEEADPAADPVCIIEKPFGAEQLVGAVRKLLANDAGRTAGRR